MPPITLWFLQSSRCIRTAWLLEELGLDYEVKFSERVNQKAPEEFKVGSRNPLGKFATLPDGNLTIYESGAISDYLCETYDKAANCCQKTRKSASKCGNGYTLPRERSCCIVLRSSMHSDTFPKVRQMDLSIRSSRVSTNVQNDLAWLETELSLAPGKFLCGEHPTAADIMMQLSADFILERELGTVGKEYPSIRAWLERCRETEECKRAVEKTGHKL